MMLYRISCRVLKRFFHIHKVCSASNLDLKNMEGNKNIGTFIFFDCETTGLPHQEYNKTRITEICLAAISAKHLKCGNLRIESKLTLCFNPQKLVNPAATKITGLSNDLLEFQPTFGGSTADVILGFMNLFTKPICLVAHNGFNFDFPIIKAEFKKCEKSLPEDLLCIDTLQLFRFLHKQEVVDNETFDDLGCTALPDDEEPIRRAEIIQKINETTPTKNSNKIQISHDVLDGSRQSTPAARKQLIFGKPSFKLGDVYQRLLNKEPIDAHRAESDVEMMIKCAASFKEKFVDLATDNVRMMMDVPTMSPGKKIGS